MAYSADVVERARILHEQGHGYELICAELGIAVPTFYSWRRRGFARPTTPHGNKKPAGERETRMASMYRQGLSLEQIGEHFGVTRERARQLLRKHGITRADGGQAVRASARKDARLAKMNGASLARWGIDHAAMKQHRKSGVLRAFESQRNCAGQRGIEWSLTFAQWLRVWEESGKLAQRGRGKDCYAMSRIKDSGGYEIGNVHIQTNAENGREAVKQWVGKQKENRGVFCIYPGTDKPYIARYGRTQIARCATEAEAVAARDAYLRENGLRASGAGRGRGWTYEKRATLRPYTVVALGTRVGSFATQEEAEVAYRAHVEAVLAERAQRGVVGADPSGFDSLNSHGLKHGCASPATPLN